MSEVITVAQMMKYEHQGVAIFPAGTIITPSARDWASEHNIKIADGKESCGSEKTIYLEHVIASVVKSLEQIGNTLKKEELPEVVSQCLQKLGCKVV